MPKPKRKPRRILLDEYHVDIYIRPTDTLSDEERRVLKTLMSNYLEMLANRINKEMGNKVWLTITQ